MNWNWLPWCGDEQDGTKDSTYEDEVIQRCDHDFEQTTEQLGPDLVNSTIEDGHLVIPVNEVVEEFCEKCGEPGLDGEAHPYDSQDYTHLAPYDGKWSRVSHDLVFKPEFQKEPELSVSVALTGPEEDGGNGRVLVNRTDTAESPFDVTD